LRREMQRDPDSKVKRRQEGRTFQREGSMGAKVLVCVIAALTHGTKRTYLNKKNLEGNYY